MAASRSRFRSARRICIASRKKAWRRTGNTKMARPFPGDDQRITWMRQLIEWSQELQEPGEFLSTLKVDLAPVEVYAFTPKGRVLELPKGATPVDFAYSVHTEVGHQCVGAKVNGQMVSLAPRNRQRRCRRDSYAERPQAQPRLAQFRQILSRQKQDSPFHQYAGARRSHGDGPAAAGKRIAQFPQGPEKNSQRRFAKLAAEYGLSKPDDLFAAVGFGKYSARQVLTRLFWRAHQGTEKPSEMPSPRWSRPSSACWALAKHR